MPNHEDTITSLQNPLIKQVAALKLKKHRDESGFFLAEGLRAAILAVNSGNHTAEYLILDQSQSGTDPQIAQVKKTAQTKKIRTVIVNHNVMKKICGRDNPPAAAAIARQHFTDAGKMLQNMQKCVVVLDNIRDPGNLGTVIRTGDALAIDGIIILNPSCDPYSTECVRGTMDSIFHIPIAKCTGDEFIDLCKIHKRRIIGTALQNAADFRDIPYKQPFCLLMGSEQNGLPKNLIAACDHLAKLPMTGKAESLNLAVAAGIMMYAALEPWKK